MGLGRRDRSGNGERGWSLGSHHTQMILLNPFLPMQNQFFRLILGLSALTFHPGVGVGGKGVECEGGFLNPKHLFGNLISSPTHKE